VSDGTVWIIASVAMFSWVPLWWVLTKNLRGKWPMNEGDGMNSDIAVTTLRDLVNEQPDGDVKEQAMEALKALALEIDHLRSDKRRMADALRRQSEKK